MPMRGWILYVHNVARPLARPWTGRGQGESGWRVKRCVEGRRRRERERAGRIEQKRSTRYIEFPLGPRSLRCSVSFGAIAAPRFDGKRNGMISWDAETREGEKKMASFDGR